jgi:hydroxyacylglutathione hydrolase
VNHTVTSPTSPFLTASGRLEVHQLLAWQDNLIWLLVDVESKAAAVIDGPEAGGVLEYCKAQGFELTTVLNTHTHPDHIGVNQDLDRRGLLDGLRVVGCGARASDVPGITERVGDGDRVRFGSVTGDVLLTEGHINGHISFVFENVLFCGDTMFGAGCGYLFDGPPAKMHESLARLAQLPDETLVCCAHEYTQDNLRFAWSVEPGNLDLAARIKDTWVLRSRGECSVPSSIQLEKATSPFLRGHSDELQAALRVQMPEARLDSSADVFAATRSLKDRKVYQTISDAELPLA